MRQELRSADGTDLLAASREEYLVVFFEPGSRQGLAI
jgi:hypothetical protein